MKVAKRKKRQEPMMTCSLCDESIPDRFDAKTEHLALAHPLLFIERAFQAVPRARQLGQMAATAFRRVGENLR